MGFRRLLYPLVVGSLFLAVLSSCGGVSRSGASGASPGPGTAPPSPRTVTLVWAANHEKGVNSAGGGYRVSISGQPTINVPYVSGPTAPTSTVTTLQTGTYTATVAAFAMLDAQGGSTGNLSAPSQALILNVP